MVAVNSFTIPDNLSTSPLCSANSPSNLEFSLSILPYKVDFKSSKASFNLSKSSASPLLLF